VEFPLEGGGEVRVEIPRDLVGARAGAKDASGKLQETFEQRVRQIRPIADALLSAVKDLPSAPSEAAVEFGVQLGARAGILLTSIDTAATIKVQLTWTRSDA
jgi:hypothetical protein